MATDLTGPANGAPSTQSLRAAPISGWLPEAAAVAIGFLLRLGLHLDPAAGGGDFARYMDLSGSMLRGHGYALAGELNTSLAPAYPAFLYVVRSLRDSIRVIVLVQIALSILSAFFVYRAVRPRNRRLALAALWLLVLNPWIAALSTIILSETFTFFVIAVCVYLLSRLEIGPPTPTLHFALGTALSVSVLSAPHALFFAVPVGLVVLWRTVGRPARLLSFLVGGALTLLPWQVHCLIAQGRINPTVYRFDQYPSFRGFAFTWLRTWSARPEEVQTVLFHCDRIERIPDRAFSSTTERQHLTGILSRYTQLAQLAVADDEAFRSIAVERRRRHPARFYLVQPFLRAFFLWADIMPLWLEHVFYAGPDLFDRLTPGYVEHLAGTQGWLRAGKLTLVNLVPFGFWIVYAGYNVVILLLLANAFRSRSAVAFAICFWFVSYSLASGLLQIEQRRNFTLFPALFFLSFYVNESVLRRGRPRSRGPAASAV